VDKEKYKYVISSSELNEKLPLNLRKLVNRRSQYEIVKFDPIKLISPKRLDILAKYIYVKYREDHLETSFAEELYLSHIESFNNFVEADGSGKIGPEAFLTSMNSLSDSLKKEGFHKSNPIPLSRDSVPLDGAHRVGASLALNSQVEAVMLDVDSPTFDYKFFQNRGLSEVFLDFIACQYVEIKEDTRVVVVWPSAVGYQAQILAILNKYGSLVYHKNVYLNSQGAHGLVRLAYKREKWVGSLKDSYTGAKNKANMCFLKEGPVRVFLIESNVCLIDMKDEIRDLFKIGKHSVHINDTHHETTELAQVLFNENSIELINNMILNHLSWFERLFGDYRSWLMSQEYNIEKFCIDGSGTLAAFGIRDVRDLDFLYSGNEVPSTGSKEIDCHNTTHMHKDLKVDDIIHDPRNYFYHLGLKFVCIRLLRGMKGVRNEDKDRHDIKLIDSLFSGFGIEIPLKDRIKRLFSIQVYISKIKLIALKIRYRIYKINNL
jgi:hypothetical protein